MELAQLAYTCTTCPSKMCHSNTAVKLYLWQDIWLGMTFPYAFLMKEVVRGEVEICT